jgi:hypothetical protein
MASHVTRRTLVPGILPSPLAFTLVALVLACVTLISPSCKTRTFDDGKESATSDKKKGKKGSDGDTPESGGKLEITGELNIKRDDGSPLIEISALTRWNDPLGVAGGSAIAASDRSFQVVSFELGTQPGSRKSREWNLAPALEAAGENASGDSQWEAAAADGSGALFLMQETVWSLDKDVEKPEGLMFDEGLTPILASDVKDKGSHVFTLETPR